MAMDVLTIIYRFGAPWDKAFELVRRSDGAVLGSYPSHSAACEAWRKYYGIGGF